MVFLRNKIHVDLDIETNTIPYIYSPEQHRNGIPSYESKVSLHEYRRPCEKEYQSNFEISERKEKKVDQSQLRNKSNENGTEEHRVIKWIRDCEQPIVDLMDDAPKVLGF